MEEIKMYAVKWKGKASECEYEVAKVMRKIAETCVQACADDAFTTISEDGAFLGCKNIKINIVTTKKRDSVLHGRMDGRIRRNKNGSQRDPGIPPPPF